MPRSSSTPPSRSWTAPPSRPPCPRRPATCAGPTTVPGGIPVLLFLFAQLLFHPYRSLAVDALLIVLAFAAGCWLSREES